MKKIGILTCIQSNQVCTGAGCLNAFYRRSDFFRDYGEDTMLAAFMTCNGCESDGVPDPGQDPGMLEKLERLTQEGIDTIHVGVCRLQRNGQECPRMTQICQLIEQQGITVLRGTHRE